MPVFQAAYLQKLAADVFRAAGADDHAAETVAEMLVEANLTGHDSHGVIYIVDYLNRILEGKLNAKAEPEIVRETATTLRVDGHWGFGQVIATWTMQHLIRKARQNDLAAAAIFNCGHIGRVGLYPAMASKEGLIALAFANGGGSKPRVAPFGGMRAMLGTNPLAATVPVAGRPPLVLDFSTSIVASGKIRIVQNKGEALPAGWILDRDGRPSSEPQAYYDGGMLLPAAGHKGYCLGMLVDILGGLLSGAGTPTLPDGPYKLGNGVFFLAVNIEAFQPAEDFTSEVLHLCDTLKATPSLNNGSGGGVLVPGEPEERMKARLLKEGITLPETTWKKISDAAQKVGITASSN
jgi:LDH2 family malate/lactate/ureidoglycolate dehydrogenase